MKTNSIWMGAAIGFALVLLFAAPQRAVAQWTTASNGNDVYKTNTTGNVGIGTTSPSDPLHVSSASGVNIRLTDSANSVSSYFTQISNWSVWQSNRNPITGTKPDSGRTVAGIYFQSLSGDSSIHFQTSTTNGADPSERMVIDKGGNVGIGTTTPNRKFELVQDVGGLSFEVGSGSPNSGAIRFGDNTGWKLHFGRSRESNGGALNSGTSGALVTIQDNGNFGIGITTPNYKLDVNGSTNVNGNIIAAGTINAIGGLNINGSPIAGSVFGRTGAVVQATNDYTWAQINKNTSSLGDLATRACANLSNAAAFCSSTDAANLTGTVGAARLGSGTADANTFLRGDNTWAVPSGATQWTTGSGNISYTGGNVGIGGTPGTGNKLDVNGNTNVTGDISLTGHINARYQDLAEWVPSSEQLHAGTVVVLDSSKSNQVIASSVSYDTRVAGVISEQPGIALGEGGANKVLVATTGRVRVKVDATHAPIQVGDLLVASDIPGMAMKSEPVNIGGIQLHRPGTLIGKALEPLAKGQGTILVLLSLQ